MTEPIIMDEPPLIRRDRTGKVCEITFKPSRFYGCRNNDDDYIRSEPQHVCMDEDRAYEQKYGRRD